MRTRNKLRIALSFLTATISIAGSSAPTFEVDPAEAVIVIPREASSIQRLAASELRKHLQLITGVAIPVATETVEGKYNFHLSPPAADAESLSSEEARWSVAADVCHIYGEDIEGFEPRKAADLDPVFARSSRTGTLYAVYDFLENNFGVRWIEPGDAGIAYPETATLKLEKGEGSWSPGTLIQRRLRLGYDNPKTYIAKTAPELPTAFRLTRSEYEDAIREVELWLKRQRMGFGIQLRYGHAFTRWWELYGKDHPEYFAMQEDGVRRPQHKHLPDRSKICVSNPEVHDRILANWQSASPLPRVINVCENDSGGYCRCPDCMKLDVRLEGEEFDDHLTDRYIWFANEIQRKAAAIDPEVTVAMYAYSRYKFPPRREKVDPRIVIGFVPSMMQSFEETAEMYRKWREAGARRIFLRPNDQHVNTGLPMGFEKQMFEHFQVGVANNIVGTDYDSLHNYWPATGVADYILARAHVDPSKSFEHWMGEYCAVYGAAAEQVDEYYNYWRREVWEARIKPNEDEIRERGRYGNFRRGLMWDIHKYYKIEDFDATDAILATAETDKMSSRELQRLETLKLANRHARLTFLAMTASSGEKLPAGRKLLAFREKHRDDLGFSWERVLEIEKRFGDVAGVLAAESFKDYTDVLPTGVYWHFRIDTENAGQKEKWETASWKEIRSDWDRLRTDRFWENQSKGVRPELLEMLRDYDGFGFYARSLKIPADWKNSEVYLYFGAVDESAWVYINGKLAGERIHTDPDDWKTPFAIRIDPFVNWESGNQTAVVRVEDTSGAGGIWKPIFLTRK